MIDYIKNIGEYILEKNPNIDIISNMVADIKEGELDTILKIDIRDGKVISPIESKYFNEITRKALFFQAGNGIIGGGMRLDHYYDLNKKGEIKGIKKLESICLFSVLSSCTEEIRNTVEEFLEGSNKKVFLVFLKDGDYPEKWLENDFLKKMYSTYFTLVKGNSHKCHMCSSVGEVYNTTTYKFYTNDKVIYGNINIKGKDGFSICESCLKKIIVGKKYISEFMTGYWLDKSVMFLPHTFNEDTQGIYELSHIDEKDSSRQKFLEKINARQEEIIEELGKSNAVTDIVFYDFNETNKTIKILYNIENVVSSRFEEIYKLLEKYRDTNGYILSLSKIYEYLASIVKPEKIEFKSKEQIQILDSIFKAIKLSRENFFLKVMKVHKQHILQNGKKFFNRKYSMTTINRIYNFLCDCGCLDRRFIMRKYSSYEEMFEENKSFFDSNEKKAWFLLGMAYNRMIYKIKEKNKSEEEDKTRTPLEKGFFFAKKYIYKTFVDFANELTDKAIKYSVDDFTFKNYINESKKMMANRENELSQEEAKYIFFWGYDTVLGNKKNEEEGKEE